MIPKLRQDLRLAFGRCRAMTAHRRKDERRHTVVLPVTHDAVNDRGNVGDASAADADRDAGAGLEPRREAAVLELPARLSPDIRKAEIGKILADEEQPRGKHDLM